MAINMFAKFGDIRGESLDDRHREEIEVLSWTWGMSQTVSVSAGAGGGVGRTTFNDLSFVHLLDKASPVLMKACATGEHIREATITARKAGQGQHDYLVIRLNDVLITGVTSAASEDARILESVSVRFGKVELEYRAQRPDGSLDAGTRFAFDVRANRLG